MVSTVLSDPTRLLKSISLSNATSWFTSDRAQKLNIEICCTRMVENLFLMYRIIIYFVLKYFTIENCDIRGFIWFSIFKLLFCSHTDTNFSASVDRPTAIQTVHNCIFQQISANTFENTYLCDSPSIVGRDKVVSMDHVIDNVQTGEDWYVRIFYE